MALAGVEAFLRLREWSIRLAVPEGAVKEWDCTGVEAAKIAASHVANVHSAGGALSIIAMDEPLVSGTKACMLSLDCLSG